jgi:hypothetical protein
MVRKGKAMERVEVVVVCLLIIAMDIVASLHAIKVENVQNRQVSCSL